MLFCNDVVMNMGLLDQIIFVMRTFYVSMFYDLARRGLKNREEALDRTLSHLRVLALVKRSQLKVRIIILYKIKSQLTRSKWRV